ncbi:hypothetical protein HH310_12415 [Actinoplanes sp. TBRC 11911]|uniref:hypothetical protein n=1 Tax=Actinoplanes sp. TBRC 11911 TaxID=2729386 RepID=UPI00145D5B0D|nr:hypothetical protein [Actinoplanes sp. TBRC 11911]NMO51997.1 hypothetical protein [Actinoplanes sp. TBRC 11911]
MSSTNTKTETIYETGELVSVYLTDAVVRQFDQAVLTLTVTAGSEITIDTTSANVRVTRTRPADGVPQPGEVWQDRFGGIWFARGYVHKVDFYGADANSQHPGFTSKDWDTVNRDFGPIKRIWSPPAAAAQPGNGGDAHA